MAWTTHRETEGASRSYAPKTGVSQSVSLSLLAIGDLRLHRRSTGDLQDGAGTGSPEMFIRMLDHLQKQGVCSGTPSFWASPTRTFSPGASGSLLAHMTSSSVGRDFVVRDLRTLCHDKSYLLQHPVVVKRLFGMAVELRGCWDPQGRRDLARTLLYSHQLEPCLSWGSH